MIVTLNRWLWIAAGIAAACPAGGGVAQAAGHVNWLSGVALQRQLAEPEPEIFWAENPLRKAMTDLSRLRRVAILIDRRVDPGQKLDVSLQGVPLGTVLGEIARGRGLGVSRLSAVVYLGPLSAAERLPAVAYAWTSRFATYRQACSAGITNSVRWRGKTWPRHAELLAELGRQGGTEIANLEQVPHDLWAAADLPPLSLVDRLTLVAIQFDLTFRVTANGSRLELVPVPENLPAVPQRDRGLAGPRVPAGGRTPSPASGQDRFQINVQEKPLGPVLRQLANRLDLDLRMDEQAIRAGGHLPGPTGVDSSRGRHHRRGPPRPAPGYRTELPPPAKSRRNRTDKNGSQVGWDSLVDLGI